MARAGAFWSGQVGNAEVADWEAQGMAEGPWHWYEETAEGDNQQQRLHKQGVDRAGHASCAAGKYIYVFGGRVG